MFGLTTAGVRAKRQEDVETDLRAAIAASSSLGANLNTDPRSPLGQIVVIMAAAIAAVWSFGEQVLMGARVLTAGGVQLDRLGQNYAMPRDPAVASTVTLTLTGTPTTPVPAGTEFSLADSGAVFIINTAATIGGGGTVDVAATAAETGPTSALARSAWAIDTPVAGLTGASNALDATVGRDVETDGAYRARLLAGAGRGTNNVAAITAAVLRVSGVTSVLVIENETAAVDADGRPAKSFEVVVRGGADADIAAAIWATKPAGIETTTTVSGPNQVSEVIVDGNGQSRTVFFSRVDNVNAYVEIDYRSNPRIFPTNGETLIQAAVLDFGSRLDVGDDVYPSSLEQAVLCALPERSLQLFTLRVGLAPAPVSAIVIPTSQTQLPSFDSSRITIAQV